jgi:hypothetical protein
MTTLRWYLTIFVFQTLNRLGFPVAAESWAVKSGLKQALLRGLRSHRCGAHSDEDDTPV